MFLNADSELEVFDRYAKRYMTKPPGAIAFARDYYTVDLEDEKDSAELEKAFGKIETIAKPIFDKIATGASLTRAERQDFGMFIALQNFRVPDAEKGIVEGTQKMYKAVRQRMMSMTGTHPEAFAASQKKAGELFGYPSPLTPEDWIRAAGEEVEVDVPKEYVRRIMLDVALESGPQLADMDWEVLHAPKGTAFILSDSPCVILNQGDSPFRSMGILSPGALKAMPLSKESCLLIRDRSIMPTLVHKNCPRKLARFINNLIALNSDKYVLSHNKALLQRIVMTTKVDQYIRTQRVQVN